MGLCLIVNKRNYIEPEKETVLTRIDGPIVMVGLLNIAYSNTSSVSKALSFFHTETVCNAQNPKKHIH